ncbi:Regulator of chromosome condensation (RCC1) repeat protein [Actinomadura rubteroloni]|uniref:Regulator of chromosome condensation (RCC1) repeat protein n=1 Tax=Actinomadura rubteroloni TaxID=1926885 RepID=A0A2P4ULC7_9ACTN|nr:S8 family serine peptidase [Actinomadura rubteroloni]POM25853.1 Regulator of chromosome condensation (RCC1) repeat protein [Actinomadura rubteroloni]
MSSPSVRGRPPAAWRRPLVALTALALGATSLGITASPADAQAKPRLKALYDHSHDKGKPGTRGPLPKGFSTTTLKVKFQSEAKVRLRGGKLTGADSGATAQIQKVLAKYPGATVTRLSQRSEKKLDDERAALQEKTGREMPDFNSWYVVRVPNRLADLVTDLNALPSVEIAQAQPRLKNMSEPLRGQQRYRNPVGDPAGTGMDVDGINSVPGGKGDNITVADVDSGTVQSAAFGLEWGDMAAGLGHTLAVDLGPSAPTVWATGSNNHGQLGDGTTTNRTTPAEIPGLSGVKVVAAAGDYSLALKTDGTVWAWGSNGVGQLGDGTTTERHTPVQVSGITNATAISAGSDGHALAVLADGTVKAWGSNSTGQLGDGTTTNHSTPITVPGLTGVKTTWGAVAAGGGQSLAVLTSGTIKAWGSNSSGQLGDGTTTNRTTPVSVSGITTGKQVAGGGFHSLAVLTDGSVKAWGLNGSGQLGDGTTTSRNTPVSVPLSEPIGSVVAGGFHSAAQAYDPVTHDHYSAWAWGYNSHGQVGDGTTTNRTSPTELTNTGFITALAAGAQHTVSEVAIGNAAWGYNSSGQLGLGDTTDRTHETVWDVRANYWNTCHEEFTGRPSPGGDPTRIHTTWGSNCLSSTQSEHGTAISGIIGARDDNNAGIAGIAPHAKLLLSGTGADIVDTIDALGAGDVIAAPLAWVVDGKEYPFEWEGSVYDAIVQATARGTTFIEAGGNKGTNLDDPADANAVTIMSRPDSGAIIAGAGAPPSPGGSNCLGSSPPAERTAINLAGWWASSYGSRVDLQAYGSCVATLGVTGYQDLTPSETDPNKMYRGTFNGTSSATGILGGVVATVQGVAKKYGTPLTPQQVRQLLKQTGTPQPAGDTRHIGPQPNLRAAVAALRGGVSAGGDHTLDVKNDGTVWAWGSNASGQLGDGTTTNRTTPVQVSGLTNIARTIGSIDAGGNHSLAVKSDGTVVAWGSNASGQLGDGTTTNRTAPVAVSGLTNVRAVSAGDNFSLALKNDGTVWAWGNNANAQLGDGTTTNRTTPVQVSGLTSVASIGTGQYHGLAVRTDGTVRAWGDNGYGQLGDGTTTDRPTPVTVSGLSGVSTWPGAVAGGLGHSLALLADGSVKAWGLNASGEIGDGTTTNRTTPVAVSGLSDITSLSAGAFHSVAVRANGAAMAWGSNLNGSLGDGTTTTRTTPVTVTGLGSLSGIAAGNLHTVAVRPAGAVYGWGDNNNGELGDGTTTDRYTAVAILP